MNIKKLSYELYKVDWKKAHGITSEREMKEIKNYYIDLIDSGAEYTFNDYIEEFGYDGELYACYEEFLDCEYEDTEYMKALLSDKSLIKQYLEDIENF